MVLTSKDGIRAGLKATIEEAMRTPGRSFELRTGTDELGVVHYDLSGPRRGVWIELGWNEHEMETLGVYDDAESAYEAVRRDLGL